eukprot:403823_1
MRFIYNPINITKSSAGVYRVINASGAGNSSPYRYLMPVRLSPVMSAPNSASTRPSIRGDIPNRLTGFKVASGVPYEFTLVGFWLSRKMIDGVPDSTGSGSSVRAM